MENQSVQELNFSSIPQVKGKNGCQITKDLRGQIIVITGASAGIGKETARILAYMGATIIFACRDENKTLPVIDEIQKETKNQNLKFIRLDLGDLQSIKEFAQEFSSKYQKLNILINNAGVNTVDRKLTKDGFEMQFGTNHLGHFYLTTLLLEIIKKSGPSRIINVSSRFHARSKMRWSDLMYEEGYSGLSVYGQSKLANVLFAKELQDRVNPQEVKAFSLHPGVIKTEIARDYEEKWYFRMVLPIYSWFMKTPLEGAQTTLYCALEDFEELEGGGYYVDCQRAEEAAHAKSEEDRRRLWEVSEKLINEKLKN